MRRSEPPARTHSATLADAATVNAGEDESSLTVAPGPSALDTTSTSTPASDALVNGEVPERTSQPSLRRSVANGLYRPSAVWKLLCASSITTRGCVFT